MLHPVFGRALQGLLRRRMGYSDDEFEDDGASPSPEPPRPRPPQGQSPTKLGVMRSPRSAPKIPVAQARETPCAMRPAPWRLRSANSAVRRGCAGEPHHPNAADGSREDRPDGETGGASPLASARARLVASRLSAGGVCAQVDAKGTEISLDSPRMKFAIKKAGVSLPEIFPTVRHPQAFPRTFSTGRSSHATFVCRTWASL